MTSEANPYQVLRRRFARPNQLVALYHWAMDADECSFAEGLDGGDINGNDEYIVSLHPCTSIAGTLLAMPPPESGPVWHLRMGLAPIAEIVKHLVSYDCAQCLHVSADGIYQLVTLDLGGRIDWHQGADALLSARERAKLTHAMQSIIDQRAEVYRG